MSVVDSASITDGAELRADVCVVGAGPAGIALARELDAAGVSAVLIDRGGRSRLGGTTNEWHGRLGLLDAIDFEVRDWVPFSGWPIARTDVYAYAERGAR